MNITAFIDTVMILAVLVTLYYFAGWIYATVHNIRIRRINKKGFYGQFYILEKKTAKSCKIMRKARNMEEARIGVLNYIQDIDNLLKWYLEAIDRCDEDCKEDNKETVKEVMLYEATHLKGLKETMLKIQAEIHELDAC